MRKEKKKLFNTKLKGIPPHMPPREVWQNRKQQ